MPAMQGSFGFLAQLRPQPLLACLVRMNICMGAKPGKLNFEQWSKLFLIDDPVVALASPEQQEQVRVLDNIINNYLPG